MAGALTISTLNDSSGVLATQNGMSGIAKAWVRFNGVSGTTIAGSFNVGSVTRNASDDYTVNFTTAMPDTNFSVSSIGSTTTDSYNGTMSLYAGSSIGASPFTTSSVRVRATGNGGLGNYSEPYYACVVVHR